MITTLSFVAAAFTTLSFLPQAIKVIRTKNTSGISFSMYLMFTIGVFLWCIYGIATNQLAVALANGTTLIFAIVILKHTMDDIKKAKRGQLLDSKNMNL